MRISDWSSDVCSSDLLNARVEDQSLWDDPKLAQSVMRERQRLDEAITATRAIENELADTAELIELAEAEGDEEMAAEGTENQAALARRADESKVKALTPGKADANDTYIEVTAGEDGKTVGWDKRGRAGEERGV